MTPLSLSMSGALCLFNVINIGFVSNPSNLPLYHAINTIDIEMDA